MIDSFGTASTTCLNTLVAVLTELNTSIAAHPDFGLYVTVKSAVEGTVTVVAKAGNGYDALELIEKFKPDVVLTDIKMPFIDGIELARIIRRDYPTVKVAFISGYDEFDY